MLLLLSSEEKYSTMAIGFSIILVISLLNETNTDGGRRKGKKLIATNTTILTWEKLMDNQLKESSMNIIRLLFRDHLIIRSLHNSILSNQLISSFQAGPFYSVTGVRGNTDSKRWWSGLRVKKSGFICIIYHNNIGKPGTLYDYNDYHLSYLSKLLYLLGTNRYYQIYI